MNDYPLEALATRIKALGHPVRLGILDVLRREPECVCHLESALNRPQPYLSQQLRVLREAGLIADERDGTNIYYRVADDASQWLRAVMGPVDMPGANSVRRDDSSLPAGRLAGCPCPKCRAAADECGCAPSDVSFVSGGRD